MTTWVDRLGNKTLETQAQLEKLRRKYEKKEAPPPETSALRGFDFQNIGSLFPELQPPSGTSGRATAGMPPPPPLDFRPSRLPPPPPPPERLSPVSDVMTAPPPPPDLLTSTERAFAKRELINTLSGSEVAKRNIFLTPKEKRLISEQEYFGKQPAPPEAIRGLVTKVSKAVFAASETPLITIKGVPISAGDIVGVGLLAYGGYEGFKAISPQLKSVAEGVGAKLYESTFGKSLDRMIASRGRGMPPGDFSRFQNFVYDLVVKNKVSIIEKATERMQTRMGRTPNPSIINRVVRDVAKETVKDIEALIPKGTQTGAMAFGGRAARLNQVTWDAMPVAQRVTQAQAAGLSGQVGSKPFETLTAAEKTALGKVSPPAPEQPEITPAPEVTKPVFKIRVWNPKGEPVAVDIQGRSVTIPGLEEFNLFVHKEAYSSAGEAKFFNRYHVSEVTTGLRLTPEASRTQVEAIAKAKEVLSFRGIEAIRKAITQSERITPTEPSIPQAKPVTPTTPAVKPAIVKYPATPAGAEARAQAEGISIAEASRLNAEESLQPTPQPAQAVPSPVTEAPRGITPEQETALLAEQVKAKLAAEPPPAKPEPTKTPLQRRDEIKTLLAEPAKNLPKGTSKIALRKELAELNKSLIPQEKKLRQQIMASVKSKSLPEKQYRDIFKATGGSRQLSTIGLPELEKVLSAVQRARPKKIAGKTVLTEKTEKAIRSLKTELVNQGKLTEIAYKDIMKYLRLRVDRFNNPDSFITESQAKELIRQMNYEAEVGLIQRDNEIAQALSNKPEIKGVIDKLNMRFSVEQARNQARQVGVSPLWDMHLYLEKLQERTGERFADVWELAIRTVYRNEALLTQMDEELAQTVGDDFAKIAGDESALQRINDVIASKHNVEGLTKVEVPSDITPAEQKIADHIGQELFDLQNKVRQTRFYTSYRENKGNVDAIALDIPNAPKKDIREASEIYESQSRNALNQYLDTKTWGVIKSGYEPHNAVNYRLRIAPSKEAAVGKSHLRSREVSTSEQDRNILDRRRSYLRQAMNWDLEAYLRKFDQMMVDVAPNLKNPNQVKNILEQAMRELKGYHPTDIMTRAIQRATSYAFSTLALSPAMTARNALQNIVMHPHREALLYLFNTKLDDTGHKYFDTFVSQQSSIVTDLLLQEGMGNTRLEQLVRRLTYYGWAETKINRGPGFLASYGKALKALNEYRGTGKLSEFVKSSGIEELTPLEQKQVLEMMAQETIDFGVDGLESVSGEDAAIYEIARRIVQQAHFNYKRSERAPVEMGAQGRTWGSLMTFPRNVGQRIYQDALRVKNGDARQKWLAARRVIAILVFSTIADYLLRKVMGTDRREYNPLNIIGSWGLGGLAAGVGETAGDVIRNAVGAVTGEDGAIDRLIYAIPRAGDMFTPFYKSTMDLIEALSDTKYVDRRALREVKQLLDENYKLRPDYYEQERNWIQKIQHAIFGGGNVEATKEEPEPKLGRIKPQIKPRTTPVEAPRKPRKARPMEAPREPRTTPDRTPRKPRKARP